MSRFPRIVVWLGLALLILIPSWISLRNLKRSDQKLPIYSQNLDRNPLILPCPGESAELEARFPGVLRLHKGAAQQSQIREEELIESAIQVQLRHLVGFLKHDSKTLQEGRFLPSAVPPKIEIQKKMILPYGQDLTLDALEDSHAGAYQKAATTRGKTSKLDEAIEVHYQARLKILACMKEGKPLPQHLQVLFPYDPYLSYWAVPASERRPFGWEERRMKINPCASPEMVNLKLPSYYWYAYNPRARQKDAEGREGVCEDLLTPGVSHQEALASLTLLPPNPNPIDLSDLWQGKTSLQGTLIVGPLQPWTIPTERDIEYLSTRFQGSQTDLETLAKDMKNEIGTQLTKKYDYALGVLLDSLIGWSRILQDTRYTSKKEGGALLIEIQGRLIQSGKPLKLGVFYGRTEAGDPSQSPTHFNHLWKSVKTEDFLFYLGHAGMGNNFSFKQMAQSLKISEKTLSEGLRRRSNFLIGLLTCDSYSYFLNDFLRARHTSSTAPEGKTLTLQMASSLGRPHLPPAILRHIDQRWAGQDAPLHRAFANTTWPGDLFVVESYKGVHENSL